MVGQFKEDQFQDHKHAVNTYRTSGSANVVYRGLGNGTDLIQIESTSSKSGRHGDVTRGKRKGVKYIIKVL